MLTVIIIIVNLWVLS